MSETTMFFGAMSSATQPTGHVEHAQPGQINTARATEVNSLPPTILHGVKVLRIVAARAPKQFSLRVNVKLMAEQDRIKAINDSIQRRGKLR